MVVIVCGCTGPRTAKEAGTLYLTSLIPRLSRNANIYRGESLVSFLRKHDVIKIGLKQKGNVLRVVQPITTHSGFCLLSPSLTQPPSLILPSLSGTPENIQAVLTSEALPLLIRGSYGYSSLMEKLTIIASTIHLLVCAHCEGVCVHNSFITRWFSAPRNFNLIANGMTN